MKLLCIYNPKSHSGYTKRSWPILSSYMQKGGINVDSINIQSDIDHYLSTALVGESKKAYRAILGIGGDGTHSFLIHTLKQLQNRHPQIVIPPYIPLPFGTGNNLAKSFDLYHPHYYRRRRKAMQSILYGMKHNIDLGLYNNHRFFSNAISIGLDADILKHHNHLIGKVARHPLLFRVISSYLLYSLATLIAIKKTQAWQCQLRINGRPCYQGPMLNLLISNTSVYAGEFSPIRNVQANDGILDVRIWAQKTRLLMSYCASYRLFPLHSFFKTNQYQGKKFHINVTPPAPIQLDGNLQTEASEFQISIAENAIQLMLPPK